MDIDEDSANWILEFYLRQPLEERTLTSLIGALPLSNTNTRLKKLILLKTLEYQVACFSISESTLVLLEQLEEIEFRQGNVKVSDEMKHAYCAVAVECTIKGTNSNIFRFYDNARRLWRKRIGSMQKLVGNGALCSEELSLWKEYIEAAVWDESLFESIVKKGEGLNALDAVSVFLRGEWDRMGPPFLEFAAAKLQDDEHLMEILGVGSSDVDTVKEAPSHHLEDVGNVGYEKKNNIRMKLRPRPLSVRRYRGKAKLVDPGPDDVNAMELSCERRSKSPMSEEVRNVREALDRSSLDLRAVVKDPLPDALRIAAEAMAGTSARNMAAGDKNMHQDTLKRKAEAMAGTSARNMAAGEKNKNQDPVKENHVESNRVDVDGDGDVQVSTGINVGNVRRPSLMERNKSARTYEWSESIDEPEDDQAARLPSPMAEIIAALNRPGNENGKRRKRLRWTPLEEHTLMAAVREIGEGHWKAMHTKYSDVFKHRTDGDLRDKWRNMNKDLSKLDGRPYEVPSHI
ncbi:hypothetical protein ABFS82_13G191200 [Erythranthe guttata]